MTTSTSKETSIQGHVHAGPVPETSWNSNKENAGTNGELPQNDHPYHIERGVSLGRWLQDPRPEETSYIVTGLQEEIPYYFPGTFQENKEGAFQTSA